jgi:hypothetical protein
MTESAAPHWLLCSRSRVWRIWRSNPAVRLGVFVIRAFLKMRETLVTRRELDRILTQLEARLGVRLDSHETAIVAPRRFFTRAKS